MTYRPEPSLSTLDAIVLIVDQRKCDTCSSIHTVPNPKLHLRIKNTRGLLQAQQMIPLTDIYPLGLAQAPTSISQETFVVESSTECCHLCFHQRAVAVGQRDFFEAPPEIGKWMDINSPKARAARKSEKKKKELIVPTPLSEF